MEHKPIAIFNCGPTAAGKSSTTRYFHEKGYDTGVVLDYDKFFKEEHDRISKDMPNLNAVARADVADQNAYALREKMFESCLKHKQNFSYENCMPEHALEKMAKAKEAGFDVKVYVTFQNSVDKHVATEKFRRDKGTETGAFFHNDKDAEKVVRSTYNNCLKGLEKAVENSHSLKVFINYMQKDPEQNRPKLVGHYKEGKIIDTGNKCTNIDVKEALDKINQSIEVKKSNENKQEASVGPATQTLRDKIATEIKAAITSDPQKAKDFMAGKEVLIKLGKDDVTLKRGEDGKTYILDKEKEKSEVKDQAKKEEIKKPIVKNKSVSNDMSM